MFYSFYKTSSFLIKLLISVQSIWSIFPKQIDKRDRLISGDLAYITSKFSFVTFSYPVEMFRYAEDKIVKIQLY